MANNRESVKIAVPYEARASYHEGLIVRAAIGLKVMYREKVLLTIISSIPEFIDALHAIVAHIYPLLIVPPDKMDKYNLRGHRLLVYGRDHPSLKELAKYNMRPVIIGNHLEEELSFDSLVYRNKFTYPDLASIETKLIPKNIRLLSPHSFVLR